MTQKVAVTPTDDPALTRGLLSEENDAASSYEGAAAQTSDGKAKELYHDIAREEKVHAGELSALLDKQDPQAAEAQQEGMDEAAEKVGGHRTSMKLPKPDFGTEDRPYREVAKAYPRHKPFPKQPEPDRMDISHPMYKPKMTDTLNSTPSPVQDIENHALLNNSSNRHTRYDDQPAGTTPRMVGKPEKDRKNAKIGYEEELKKLKETYAAKPQRPTGTDSVAESFRKAKPKAITPEYDGTKRENRGGKHRSDSVTGTEEPIPNKDLQTGQNVVKGPSPDHKSHFARKYPVQLKHLGRIDGLIFQPRYKMKVNPDGSKSRIEIPPEKMPTYRIPDGKGGFETVPEKQYGTVFSGGNDPAHPWLYNKYQYVPNEQNYEIESYYPVRATGRQKDLIYESMLDEQAKNGMFDVSVDPKTKLHTANAKMENVMLDPTTGQQLSREPDGREYWYQMVTDPATKKVIKELVKDPRSGFYDTKTGEQVWKANDGNYYAYTVNAQQQPVKTQVNAAEVATATFAPEYDPQTQKITGYTRLPDTNKVPGYFRLDEKGQKIPVLDIRPVKTDKQGNPLQYDTATGNYFNVDETGKRTEYSPSQAINATAPAYPSKYSANPLINEFAVARQKAAADNLEAIFNDASQQMIEDHPELHLTLGQDGDGNDVLVSDQPQSSDAVDKLNDELERQVLSAALQYQQEVPLNNAAARIWEVSGKPDISSEDWDNKFLFTLNSGYNAAQGAARAGARMDDQANTRYMNSETGPLMARQYAIDNKILDANNEPDEAKAAEVLRNMQPQEFARAKRGFYDTMARQMYENIPTGMRRDDYYARKQQEAFDQQNQAASPYNMKNPDSMAAQDTAKLAEAEDMVKRMDHTTNANVHRDPNMKRLEGLLRQMKDVQTSQRLPAEPGVSEKETKTFINDMLQKYLPATDVPTADPDFLKQNQQNKQYRLNGKNMDKILAGEGRDVSTAITQNPDGSWRQLNEGEMVDVPGKGYKIGTWDRYQNQDEWQKAGNGWMDLRSALKQVMSSADRKFQTESQMHPDAFAAVATVADSQSHRDAQNNAIHAVNPESDPKAIKARNDQILADNIVTPDRSFNKLPASKIGVVRWESTPAPYDPAKAEGGARIPQKDDNNINSPEVTPEIMANDNTASNNTAAAPAPTPTPVPAAAAPTPATTPQTVTDSPAAANSIPAAQNLPPAEGVTAPAAVPAEKKPTESTAKSESFRDIMKARIEKADGEHNYYTVPVQNGYRTVSMGEGSQPIASPMQPKDGPMNNEGITVKKMPDSGPVQKSMRDLMHEHQGY